jgi:hypothetical protein
MAGSGRRRLSYPPAPRHRRWLCRRLRPRSFCEAPASAFHERDLARRKVSAVPLAKSD